MRPVTSTSFQLGLAMLLMLPMPALAVPAITCHCFTDRSYDAERPAAADPYFLATTQNSFFAAAFGIDKKTIVVKKQKGYSADDLWVAYWLAARSGADPESLIQEHKANGSWRQVATPLAVPAKSLGGRFAEALKANAADDQVAKAVVDELLLRFRFHGEPELTALRKAGAGNQEMVMAGLLTTRIRLPASQLYSDVKSGKTTWGALLQRAKIDPSAIESDVSARIRAATAR